MTCVRLAHAQSRGIEWWKMNDCCVYKIAWLSRHKCKLDSDCVYWAATTRLTPSKRPQFTLADKWSTRRNETHPSSSHEYPGELSLPADVTLLGVPAALNIDPISAVIETPVMEWSYLVSPSSLTFGQVPGSRRVNLPFFFIRASPSLGVFGVQHTGQVCSLSQGQIKNKELFSPVTHSASSLDCSRKLQNPQRYRENMQTHRKALVGIKHTLFLLPSSWI